VRPPTGSWGAGKDLRLWEGPQVADLLAGQRAAQGRLRDAVRRQRDRRRRDRVLDQLARETLLAASSDWAFMVSRDQAGDYGRRRALGHVRAAEELARAAERAPEAAARALADRWRAVDGPLGHLDARALLRR
jgi:1,4-alpha-glucan branching enzyme